MTDFAHRRIERARHQYENLLIHAGSVLFTPDDDSGGRAESMESDKRSNVSEWITKDRPHPNVHDQLLSPHQYAPAYIKENQNSFNKAEKNNGNRVNYANSSFSKSGTKPPKYNDKQSDVDKDYIITALRSDNDRLKAKLDSTITYAEEMIQAAQLSQESIMDNLSTQDHTIRRRNTRLEDENQQLKVMLQLTQSELEQERAKLLKATRLIERVSRRSLNSRKNGQTPSRVAAAVSFTQSINKQKSNSNTHRVLQNSSKSPSSSSQKLTTTKSAGIGLMTVNSSSSRGGSGMSGSRSGSGSGTPRESPRASTPNFSNGKKFSTRNLNINTTPPTPQTSFNDNTLLSPYFESPYKSPYYKSPYKLSSKSPVLLDRFS